MPIRAMLTFQFLFCTLAAAAVKPPPTLNDILDQISAAHKNQKPALEKSALNLLETRYSKPPEDFAPAFQSLLGTAQLFMRDRPDVPGLFKTSTLLLSWASSADMAKVPADTFEKWMAFNVFSLPKLGRANELAGFFELRPQLKASMSNGTLEYYVTSVCTYYSEAGRFGECAKEISEARKRIGGRSDSLDFDEAKSIYFQGRIPEAIEKMNAIAASSEKIKNTYMVPWIYGAIATMQIMGGQLAEGKATFERYRAGTADSNQNPWFNSSYAPRIKSLILIHEKSYAQAKRELTALRSGLQKATEGVPVTAQAHTDLLLLAVSALMKKPADVKKYHKLLNEDLAHLPSVRHLGILGDAVSEASLGRDPASRLHAAVQQLGPQHPDLKFFESLISLIKKPSVKIPDVVT